MAERLTLEPEVQKILSYIDRGENILLSGGAGSGKTYSLVQVIKQVIEERPTSKVACMTYTNAAVKQIEERVNHNNLVVSTIHDFLWDNIKHFQQELKDSLVLLINDEESKIKNPENNYINSDYFDSLVDGIQYKEYLKIKEGIISHDELLILANQIFKTQPKLCSILKDKFEFIFIDEFQDTNKNVIEIFLTHLKQSPKKNIIGFFGDAMQSIYDDGIGDLDEYKGPNNEKVKEVKKEQNRRNPQLIISLANKLRTDGLQQTPSIDEKAPNMSSGTIKTGSIKFYHSNIPDVEKVKTVTCWDYNDTKETKILNLTHNLIAPKAGFANLMGIYNGDKIIDFKNRIRKYIKKNSIETDFSEYTFGQVIDFLRNGKTGAELKKVSPTNGMKEFIDLNAELFDYAKSQQYEALSKIYLDKDQLIDDKKQDAEDENKKGSKRDDLINHLFKIQNNITLYKNGQYNEFINTTEYKVSSIEDKITLKKQIEKLIDVGNKNIEVIISKADEFGICKKDDRLNRFIADKRYVYDRVKNLKFSEFQNLYNYLEGYTPFSTQHKTKGAEFKNVLIILNNGNWNDYNFEYLFNPEESLDELNQDRSRNRGKINSHPKILLRTQKIFYVCCTRAKESLAVFFHDPSPSVITKAKEWFGSDNIIQI